MGHSSPTHCKHNGGRADSVSPHHNVTLELSIPLLDGDLHEIMIGVGFRCGCDDDYECEDDYKTYNWSLKNKTDDIVIDSGTVCPYTSWDEDICHKGRTIIDEGIILDCSACQRPSWVEHRSWPLEDITHVLRFSLSRVYLILREWRGKTVEFVLSCPDNSTKLSISSNIATSVYWQDDDAFASRNFGFHWGKNPWYPPCWNWDTKIDFFSYT